MADINNLFDYADILSSSADSNGTILLQTGSVDGAEVRSEGTEIWFPSGYVARAAKATPDKDSAQGICIVRGDQDICFATRDIRANSLVETIGYGEVFIFAGGPNNTGASKLYLSNDGSSQKVTITAGTTKIEVDSSGTVTITADLVKLSGASDFAALAAKVDSNFADMVTAITAMTASGSPIVWTPPSNPSVAASNVKIS
jgi:hypothetical protein